LDTLALAGVFLFRRILQNAGCPLIKAIAIALPLSSPKLRGNYCHCKLAVTLIGVKTAIIINSRGTLKLIPHPDSL